MGIVTKEMIEQSKKIDLKVIDKNLYDNAKAMIEIHRLRTGVKPKSTAMDTVRLWTHLDSLAATSGFTL
jgi:hypothetical protein